MGHRIPRSLIGDVAGAPPFNVLLSEVGLKGPLAPGSLTADQVID